MGVGTATIMKSAALRSDAWHVYLTCAARKSAGETSPVRSNPWWSSPIFFSLISKPITGPSLPNATAMGRPTYPSPTTAMCRLVPVRIQTSRARIFKRMPDVVFSVNRSALSCLRPASWKRPWQSPAVFLFPPIIRLLGDPEFPTGVEHGQALAGLELHGARMLNNLFRGVAPLGHNADLLGVWPDSHSIWTTSARLGQTAIEVSLYPWHENDV